MRFNRWPGAYGIALLWLPLHAFATLGGNAASIDADRAALGMASPAASSASASAAVPASNTTSPSSLPGATIQTLTLNTGTIVREYLSAAGVVFAVSWEGPVLPQLKQLLGPDNFAQYTSAMDAARSQGGSRGYANVSLPGLAVESAGHMGAFFGRAWLPSSLPAGITAKDIQ
jgi:hypothetical protein